MSSPQQHVEVVVLLRPGADAHVVTTALAGHGLRVTPIQAGLLVTGEAAAVRAAFGTESLDALRTPDALQEHVKSVELVPPKHIHEGGE